jgi:prepilin-type N-terminal cleavage/methylation domain-containing protein/prepilin-type processing-associated H-X9-DG protein
MLILKNYFFKNCYYLFTSNRLVIKWAIMRRFGFTIIELLVVLAVVAVVMGLLIPVTRAARLQAKTVVCSSNIKQILNLLAVYEQQNGVYPYGFDDSMLTSSLKGNYSGDPTCGDKKGKWWFQYIGYSSNTVAKNDSIFWCPSRCIKDPTSKFNILCGNYGVNRSICKDAPGLVGVIGSEYVGTPLSSYKILHPKSIFFVIDSGYSLISWQGATNASVKPFETIRENSFYVPGIEINNQRALLPGNKDDAIGGRHRRKTINAGYVDGHVTQLKAEELFVLEQNKTYTNLYPTWIQ